MTQLRFAFSWAFLVFAKLSLAQITENQIRVVFNDGVVLPGMSCDETDTEQLLKAIDRRRFLRSTVNQDTDTNQERKLQMTYYPASCKTTCAGFQSGTCLAQGCRGYRRETHEVETQNEAEPAEENGRVLQSKWCARAMKHADKYLDSIISSGKVSDSCIKLLQTTRRMDCLIVTC